MNTFARGARKEGLHQLTVNSRHHYYFLNILFNSVDLTALNATKNTDVEMRNIDRLRINEPIGKVAIQSELINSTS